MPRPKQTDRPVRKNICIPVSVVNIVDKLLADPITGGPRYDAYGQLITELLIRWIKEQNVDLVKLEELEIPAMFPNLRRGGKTL
jgi:hypothetical protein